MNDNQVHTLRTLQDEIHEAAYKRGWWHHADTGLPYIPGDSARCGDEDGNMVIVSWAQLPPSIRDMITHYWPMFIACKIGLIHSETSEAMEAHRKDLMDDKLSSFTGFAAESADVMIRQLDLAGAMERAARLGVVDAASHECDLAGAIRAKTRFNVTRPDHDPVQRRASGGKKY